jgi:hypothetical protein
VCIQKNHKISKEYNLFVLDISCIGISQGRRTYNIDTLLVSNEAQVIPVFNYLIMYYATKTYGGISM